MKKAWLALPAILLLVFAVPIGLRHRKDIRKKLAYQNTYAIQNVQSGKNLRPLDAGTEDGTSIILYDHHDWECLTWQLIQLEGDAYLVKNLYTQKTFQPVSSAKAEGGLWQQTLGGSRLQYWEFLKRADETYVIRLQGTDLYLTAPSHETNSPAALLPKQDSPNQMWRLVRQTPWI